MALGKNLGNILGDYFGTETVTLEDTTTITNQTKSRNVEHIPLGKISLNPYQTRRYFDEEKIISLAKSIEDHGLIHPILVIQIENNEGQKKYELVSGERRLRAYRYLGRSEIEATVKTRNEISTEEQAVLTALENLEREDLNPMEIAETYHMLIDTKGISSEILAKEMNKSEQYIKNYLRLLSLSEPVKKALIEKKLTEGQARPMVPLSPKNQLEILGKAIVFELTVKEIIREIEKLEIPKKSGSTVSNLPPQEIIDKAVEFAQFLPNNDVNVTGTSKKGKIVITWNNKK